MTLTRLLEEPNSIEPFTLLLRHIESTVNAVSSAIFVPKDASADLTLLASTEPLDKSRLKELLHAATFPISGHGGPHINIVDDAVDHSKKYIYVQLRYGVESRALLVLIVPSRFKLTKASRATLKMYSEQLANLVYSARLAQLNLRNAQYEERAAIARELHDSLAQSLSYLKIQASRLQGKLKAKDSFESISFFELDDIVEDMRSNLNVAYRHLRELITTFRLTMGRKNFSQALQDSVSEFANRCTIAFEVDNRLPGGVLATAEEIQLLHIIRECLSNVVRHSHANYAWISIYFANDVKLTVTVDDDGIGLSPADDNEKHHGIIIMQERAHKVGGELRIDERPEGGTRVSVSFQTEPQRRTDMNQLSG